MVVSSVSEYQDVEAEISWGFTQKPTDFTRLYYIQGGELFACFDLFFYELGKWDFGDDLLYYIVKTSECGDGIFFINSVLGHIVYDLAVVIY